MPKEGTGRLNKSRGLKNGQCDIHLQCLGEKTICQQHLEGLGETIFQIHLEGLRKKQYAKYI